jgi:hypothetical protein
MENNPTNPDLLPLPSTYITALESAKRVQWFRDHKYPILDALTIKEEQEHENTKLDFSDIKTAIDFFKLLIKGAGIGNEINGVRIYFASPSDSGQCGKLTLIFVATTGENSFDVFPYYGFDKGVFNVIQKQQAKGCVHNYQNIKRNHLFKTLSDQDILDGSKETKHILFSLTQFEDIIAEMEYQSQKHGDIVKNFGIRFTSYTNQDYQFGNSALVTYRRRLTIGFTFIDDKNNDIGIENIDPEEFEERMKITSSQNQFVENNLKVLSLEEATGGTFDTGVPAPPPPSDENMAALDLII